MNKNIFRIGLPLIILMLGVGMVVNHHDDSYKEELSFKEYEQSDKDAYLSFKTHLLNELKSNVNLKDKQEWQLDYNAHLHMTSNQFEGPQVHIEKFIYQSEEYRQDSVFKNPKKYRQFVTPFTITGLLFDPDDRTSGKPDIRVTVVPPAPFEETRSKTLTDILERYDGARNTISPYKTYLKEVYFMRDSTIIMQNIKMDMWLTRFSVTVETESWMKDREDEDDGRREIANQRHKPFSIVLKILPNVSPWYVNTGRAFDKKADMAIGAIYCEGIRKLPKESADIGVEPKSVGTALPLIKQDYYNHLENPDKMLEENATDKTIWNKPLYAIISVPNMGSYRTLWAKGDEQVTFDFIMPLLVRGSWDIQIPASIIPKYQPAPPYRRSLANIILPKWGLGIFGQGLSLLLMLLVCIAVGYLVLKVIV